VDGWKKNKDKILKLSADKQNAVLEKVLDYCGKVTLTDKQSDNIAAMLKELSGEMMVSFVNKLMALNRVDNLRAIHSRVRDTLMLQVTSAAKKK
jgi:hypothetical protein